jgi:hypothetical protein
MPLVPIIIAATGAALLGVSADSSLAHIGCEAICTRSPLLQLREFLTGVFQIMSLPLVLGGMGRLLESASIVPHDISHRRGDK